MPDNPLLAIGFPIAFNHVRPEHIEPAIQSLIDQASARLDQIASDPAPPTWENTLAAIDRMTEPLDRAVSVVRHLESVATTPQLRAAYNAVEPLASAFYSRIPLHEGLWRRLQAFSATAEAAALTGIRKRYLDKTIQGFRRHGAALPPDQKAELEKMDIELSQLTTRFSQNVVDSTAAFELTVTHERQLAGLPPTAVVMARESAESKGRQGWRFTLQQPSYVAVLTYLDDASIREQVYRAYHSRATSEPNDNTKLLPRILELRHKKANLLGYPDFPDFVLEDRMAHKGAEAEAFLDRLRQKTTPFFERENQQLQDFRRELEGPDAPPLAAWDVSYYSEKLRKSRYDFDEEMLRPYFPLEAVIRGMFQLVSRLYGIHVDEQHGVPVWHPDVKFYHLYDNDGTFLGGFYADWFPREDKRGGAWMDAFITGGPSPEGFEPHLGLMCGNLTPPAGGKPSLLSHRDVETIFHEFGHLLHHLLSRVEVRSLAGANVPWDFVELPSQIMENWCWERASLDLFARHYETGDPLPGDLYQRMRRARTFRAANAQMRQLSFGFTDLALHRDYRPEVDGDVVSYTRRLFQSFSPAPLPPEHAMIASFTHLFAQPIGYAAGYYSYKWAEVLDADAFTAFQQHGIFDETTGRRFRDCILSRGNSADPAELYRDFMGRDPELNALLERAGLTAIV
ncbi:MAG: M3 family metallopeptidase [Bryobacterales bacterium]|nr:M3 family metallopeptidase [Bryobacterales bacterium]